jgi:hypothetical protein
MSIPIIGDVIDAVSDIVSEVVVDKDKRDQVNLELEKLRDRANERLHEEMLAQSATNTAEAKHRSIFVAGWRPYIGWGCGSALIYNTLVAPMFGLGQADLAFLQTVLLGMLGIAGMRSFDKVKGTANDVLPVRRKKGEPENILPPLYSADLPEDAPWTK